MRLNVWAEQLRRLLIEFIEFNHSVVVKRWAIWIVHLVWTFDCAAELANRE